jgi:predicted  nucleic acid-binding Zn-ribbon protein
VDGASRHDHAIQADLERAVRVQRDTAEYAAALQQQTDLLVRAYDAAFARWNAARESLEERLREQESLTTAALDIVACRNAYVADLETDVIAAWETLEDVQKTLRRTEAALQQAEQSSEFFKNELNVATRLAAEREKRLTIAAFEARQREHAAIERADEAANAAKLRAEQAERAASLRAEQAERETQAALRKCEEHRQRGDWAADERARLAKCYEDACAQAGQIGKTLSELERDLTQTLSAKDAEIASLEQRCESLEANLLEHINAAIEHARAESERLSALVHGVQQGRFWRLKRFAQRLRRVIHR